MSGAYPEHEPFGAEHELVLEQLLCGDLDPDSPAAQELFSAHPHLRDEMLALRSTELAISQLTSDAPSVVAEAQREVTERDRSLVRASIDREGSRHRGRWALLAGGLAAAVLAFMLAGPGIWTQAPANPETKYRLSEVPYPSGEVVGSYGYFEVFEELKAGQQMLFRVFDMDGTLVAESLEDATVWEPSAEVAEAIEQQPSIIWTYNVVDGSDSSGARGSAEASKVN